jgi:hypothetical protein
MKEEDNPVLPYRLFTFDYDISQFGGYRIWGGAATAGENNV